MSERNPVLGEVHHGPRAGAETQDTMARDQKSVLLQSPDVEHPASLSPRPSYYSPMFYGIIFLESCIFPIPPDPFFIVQALKNPKKIWFLAVLCTTLSTMGGCVTYGIGFWFYDQWGSVVVPLFGGEEVFFSVQGFMQRWGAWAIIAKGFSPVPYKVMALICGVTQFSFITFLATSLLARGIRFGILAVVIHRYQEQAQRILSRYQNRIKRVFLMILISGFVLAFLIKCIKMCGLI